MSPPVLESLTATERVWVADNLARARELAATWGAGLAGLDRYWASRSEALRSAGEDPNPLINMVGIALGQYFVDELDLTWMIATDDYGTELAVYRERNRVMLYPCNLVAKRWESSETTFLEQVAGALVQQIRSIER